MIQNYCDKQGAKESQALANLAVFFFANGTVINYASVNADFVSA
jgi:hypothetical protein